MYVQQNHIGLLIYVQINPFPACVLESNFFIGILIANVSSFFRTSNFHLQLYNLLCTRVNHTSEISVGTPPLETTSWTKARPGQPF